MKTLTSLPFLTAAVLALAACSTAEPATDAPSPRGDAGVVGFQLIRNATLKLDYAGTTFLVDPMLAEEGAYPGFKGTHNSHLRNPLVGLPVPLDVVLDADAVVVTHTHLDHWDDAARQQLPKSMPIFVQDERDAATVRKDGFTDVRVLGSDTSFNGTRLTRIGGQHGTDGHLGKLAPVLGTVSGVVFERPGHETVYIAGDTIWRPEVEAAIRQHRPDVIVLNTGYARIPGFEGSIIMGKEDLARARRMAPDAVLIGVHMEAVNHATQSRPEVGRYITEANLDATRTLIPADGESYLF
ncbi:MBL fold metallo-hydrolase [Luteimonas marina]|uniref:MBL fold metallo-hydrolase n=1 Tax=Luteimonas marina TaxID=488485 RepID=A0A5C5U6I3_9GAMM|nr:MBL fold metallo-hydrolase [Luteimonas marina]TWT21418.1 MBL fold metallo-hydrolase [Luteimonas marina]